MARAALSPDDALLLVATDGVTDALGDDDALGVALDAAARVRWMAAGGGGGGGAHTALLVRA